MMSAARIRNPRCGTPIARNAIRAGHEPITAVRPSAVDRTARERFASTDPNGISATPAG
ncbi:MAG: hypothetical protein MUF78_02435 [Candidatus Edwardsbacteria bacterium]|nr:hypothetical protein [Candidatus Edwardsbacteria bacterium]